MKCLSKTCNNEVRPLRGYYDYCSSSCFGGAVAHNQKIQDEKAGIEILKQISWFRLIKSEYLFIIQKLGFDSQWATVKEFNTLSEAEEIFNKAGE